MEKRAEVPELLFIQVTSNGYLSSQETSDLEVYKPYRLLHSMQSPESALYISQSENLHLGFHQKLKKKTKIENPFPPFCFCTSCQMNKEQLGSTSSIYYVSIYSSHNSVQLTLIPLTEEITASGNKTIHL